MIGILLALWVSVLKALWELVGKQSTDLRKKGSIDEYTLVFWSRLISCIVLLPLLFFIEIPDFSLSFFLIFIFAVVWNAIANITSIKAIKYWELSIVGPLTALTLPFLLFSAYFIAGETTNVFGYIWIILIFFWTYFLGIRDWNRWFLAPIKSIASNPWARFMVITALIWSITWPLDKLWVLWSSVISWMFLSNIWVCTLIWLYIFLFRKKTDLSPMMQTAWIKKIATVSLLWWILVFMQMLALKYTLVIYVIAIKRASWIFSVIFWYIFFKEKDIFWKLFAVIIMLVWVVIISILWNI